MKKMLTLLMVLAFVAAAGTALAGAKIQVNDDAYIDLGYRLQTYFMSYQTPTSTRPRPARTGTASRTCGTSPRVAPGSG